MRLEAVRYPIGLCVDCEEYELITRLPDDGDEPVLDLERGWCAEKDCLVSGAHEPCEAWMGRKEHDG